MLLGGIDGCKGGWLVIFKNEGAFSYEVISSIETLNQHFLQPSRFFIDMPIGLSSEGFTRTLETTLRTELQSRRSTIFNPPTREATYEPDRDKAKQLNKRIEGKSLSEQTLNIKSKIRELDHFLLHQKNLALELIESHPEICFKYLNKGEVLQRKKSTSEGIEDRLRLLSSYDQDAFMLYQEILKNTQRKWVKRDDILDALVLCISNELGFLKNTYYFQDQNIQDLKGLKIRLAYFK